MQGLHRGYQNKILENHERAELCSLPNQRCQNPDLSFINDHQKADERGFMERSEKNHAKGYVYYYKKYFW